MCAGRRQRRNGHRRCCSDVVHGSRVAPRTAEVSVRKQQPADNCQPGNPALGTPVHGKQDSLAYTGSVAEQVTSAAAAMPGVMCSHRQVPVTRRAAAFCTDCSRRRRSYNVPEPHRSRANDPPIQNGCRQAFSYTPMSKVKESGNENVTIEAKPLL